MAAGDKVSIFEDLMRFKPDGMTANAWAVTAAALSRTVWPTCGATGIRRGVRSKSC